MKKIIGDFKKSYEMLTISDYKEINERYSTYANAAMFLLLVIQILYDIYDVIYLERVIIGMGIIDIGINYLIFTTFYGMCRVLYRQNKEEVIIPLKGLYEYLFYKLSNLIYQNVLPFILLFNANMIDFSHTIFADSDFTKVFLIMKLIMIVFCFGIILMCNIIKRYSGFNKLTIVLILSIGILYCSIFLMICLILSSLKYQRITLYIAIISCMIIFLIQHIPYTPFRIASRIFCVLVISIALYATITGEMIRQKKPYQFEDYIGTWVYESETNKLQYYCEITRDGDNNKLLLYCLSTDLEDNFIDFYLQESEIESYRMNKVLGRWYDHQRLICLKGKDVKDDAVPIQVSFLSSKYICGSQDLVPGHVLYQDGKIDTKKFEFVDEIDQEERQYGIIILDKELWLYGFLPFTEIDSIPQEVLNLVP